MRASNNRKGSMSKIIAVCGAVVLSFSQISLAASPPAGEGDYASLVQLNEDFFSWKKAGNNPLDRSADQVAGRLEELKNMQPQLRASMSAQS